MDRKNRGETKKLRGKRNPKKVMTEYLDDPFSTIGRRDCQPNRDKKKSVEACSGMAP